MNGKVIGCSMGAAVLLLTAGFSGRVVDASGNGVPGVVLSDGERAVRSAADGRYEFPDGGRFVRLVEPANARADRRWCPMTPGEEGIFRLTPVPARKRVRFAQVSDVETWGKEDYDSEDWRNVLGDLCRAEKTDFLLHTGDICYPQGLEFNARAVTEGQMGVPVFFLPGNHDMTQGAYGEERFERFFGPVCTAFERGNVLFILAPNTFGDHQPTCVSAVVARWMKNLLKLYPADQPVVLATHAPDLVNAAGKIAAGTPDELDLGTVNLRAFIHGHNHNNDTIAGGRFPIFGTVPLRFGGASGGAAGVRIFDIDEKGNVSCDMRWTGCDRVVRIVSPQQDACARTPDGRVLLAVTAADTVGATESVTAVVTPAGGEPVTVELTRKSGRSFQASLFDPAFSGACRIAVSARFRGGRSGYAEADCVIPPAPAAPAAKPGAPYPQFLFRPDRAAPDFLPEAEGRLTLRWIADAEGDILRASPVIADGRVFTATCDDSNGRDGAVCAFDLRTGAPLWRSVTGDSIHGAIAVGEGLVYACDARGVLHALDAADGHEVWRHEPPLQPYLDSYTGVLLAEGRVATGSDRDLRVLDARTGKLIWAGGGEGWRNGVSTPAALTLIGSTLISSGNWVQLRGHDFATGRLKWVNNDIRYCYSTGRADGDTLLLPTNRRILRVDPETGKILAQGRFDDPCTWRGASVPLCREGHIWLGSTERGLVALDRDLLLDWDTGFVGRARLWTMPYIGSERLVESSPVIIGKRLWFGASDGNFYAVDPAKGKELQRWAFGAAVLTTPAVSGNVVCVADAAGRLYGFTAD